MAFTETDLAAICAAIAKGEKTVVFADRSVTYRSIAELREAKAEIEASLSSRPKQSLGAARDGF